MPSGSSCILTLQCSLLSAPLTTHTAGKLVHIWASTWPSQCNIRPWEARGRGKNQAFFTRTPQTWVLPTYQQSSQWNKRRVLSKSYRGTWKDLKITLPPSLPASLGRWAWPLHWAPVSCSVVSQTLFIPVAWRRQALKKRWEFPKDMNTILTTCDICSLHTGCFIGQARNSCSRSCWLQTLQHFVFYTVT